MLSLEPRLKKKQQQQPLPTPSRYMHELLNQSSLTLQGTRFYARKEFETTELFLNSVLL